MHRRFRISRSSVAAAIAEIGGVGNIGASRFRATFIGADVYLASRGVVSTNLLGRTHVGVVVDVRVPAVRFEDNAMVDRRIAAYATPTYVVVDTTPQYEARADDEVVDDTRQRRRRGRQNWEAAQGRQRFDDSVTAATMSSMSMSMRHDGTVQTGSRVYAVDNVTVSASPGGPPVGRVVSVDGNTCVVSIDPMTTLGRDVVEAVNASLSRSFLATGVALGQGIVAGLRGAAGTVIDMVRHVSETATQREESLRDFGALLPRGRTSGNYTAAGSIQVDSAAWRELMSLSHAPVSASGHVRAVVEAARQREDAVVRATLTSPQPSGSTFSTTAPTASQPGSFGNDFAGSPLTPTNLERAIARMRRAPTVQPDTIIHPPQMSTWPPSPASPTPTPPTTVHIDAVEASSQSQANGYLARLLPWLDSDVSLTSDQRLLDLAEEMSAQGRDVELVYVPERQALRATTRHERMAEGATWRRIVYARGGVIRSPGLVLV